MTLEADILFSIAANETDAGDYAKDVRTTKVEYFQRLTDGTAAGQAQIVWSESESLPSVADWNPSGSNFANFQDDRGTVAFTAVKAIYVKNTGAHPVTFQTAEWPQLGFDEEIVIPAGSVFFVCRADASGWATANSMLLFSTGEQPTTTIEVMLIGEGSIT